MAFAVNDILKAQIFCVQNNQTSCNVLHFRVVSNGAVPLTEQQTVDDFSSVVATNLKPCLTSQADYYGVTLQRVAPTPVGAQWTSANGSGPGTSGGDAMPWQVAGLVGKKTALAGRRYRGRCYIPFPSEQDNQAGGTPAALYLTAIGTFGNNVMMGWAAVVGLNALTTEGGVYSKVLNSFAAMLSAPFRTKWATQRSRGQFGRPNAPPF